MSRAPFRLLAAGAIAAIVGLVGVGCGPIGSSQAPELPVSGTLPALLQPPTSSALPKGPIPNTADLQGCFPQTIIGTAAVPRVVVRSAPSPKAPAVDSFAQTNPQGSPQTFDLLQETVDRHGDKWVEALLPVRPNGTTGWIQESDLALSWTPFSLDVDTHTFTITVFRSCQPAAQFPVGIGTGDTPTPIGRFYLGSLIKPLDPTGPYGDFAYGLSAYSDVITDWRWGGLIGLHGTDDANSIGHDVSHGCIRMRNADISLLARVLPLGTPIIIH
ncbi:MAG: L,D-transpeptidase family protein [Actinomycetota bacterium]|nr:L,D-transpeptidase family protein [Actinomycetota bacterium]